MAKATASQLIDKLLKSLKPWGKYQIIQLMVVISLTWPASNQLYSIMYIGYQPPLRCHEPANISPTFNISGERPYYDTCKELFDNINATSCPYGYDYDNPKEASFATEWDLVCDRSYIAQLTQTTLVIGQAVGATLFSLLADRYGRRKASVISQLCMVVFSTASIFSPTPVFNIVTKFFAGVAHQGLVASYCVMAVELVPTSSRAIPHIINSASWSTFLVIQVGFAYWLRDVSWRYLQVFVTLASVITLIPNILWLDESIRWLFANQKSEELKKIVSKATRLNKANPDEVNAQFVACIEETDEELRALLDETNDVNRIPKRKNNAIPDKSDHERAEVEVKHKGTLSDIMKNRRLRITTFIMLFAWVVNALTNYGLSLTASKLSGNRFLNYFLISMVPTPAGFASYFTLAKFGRKKTAIIFHGLAGCVLIAAVLFNTFMGESVGGLVTGLTIVGRFAVFASWNSLFLYTPELYPTNLRSVGLGISSSASRFGGMLAPFSNIVIDYLPWLPGTVYGCSCFVVCFLVIFLPETLNRELPQTLDEMKEWTTGKVKIDSENNLEKQDLELLDTRDIKKERKPHEI